MAVGNGAREHLVRYTGKHVLPLPVGMGRAAIGALAEATALRLGHERGGFMELAISQLDGRLSHDGSKGTLVRPDGSFTVGVSSLLSHARVRLDVAMGLGHRILHHPAAKAAHPDLPMLVPYIAPDDEDPSLKAAMREATLFGWAFLMPEAAFRAEWERQDGHTGRIAQDFNVPPAHVMHRAVWLGLAEREPAAEPFVGPAR
jgi:hypothetical protein